MADVRHAWHEPEATLGDMLLTEPGSRVEGATEEILRVLYWVVHDSARQHGMPELEADAFSLVLLPRLHAEMAARGYIVRDYPDG